MFCWFFLYSSYLLSTSVLQPFYFKPQPSASTAAVYSAACNLSEFDEPPMVPQSFATLLLSADFPEKAVQGHN